MTQLAIFDLEIRVIDKPTTRRRWNGDPMSSLEASRMLHELVDLIDEKLIAEGWQLGGKGYGVRAIELEDV